MNDAVLQCRDLQRRFTEGGLHVEVLRGVSLTIARGDRVAIVGSSGSGKSTLLHLLGGLDRPTAGTVSVLGQDLVTMPDPARTAMRNRALGFIYQFHHLLQEFTAVENVALPLLLRGEPPATCRQKAIAMLEQVGLGERLRHRPAELSGGERQRAAIARALVTEPACVLADEPTGNLDRRNAAHALDLMLALNAAVGAAIIIVTHDTDIAARMAIAYELRDGVLHTLTS